MDPLTENTLELMTGLTGIMAKRMFGGHGIFHDGLMFALTCDEGLFFKVDDENRADFEALGLEPFRYEKKDGRVAVMSYCQAPEECFASPARMQRWAEDSIAAAQRADARKPRSKKKKQQR